MSEVPQQYLELFDQLAATVPELDAAFRRHLPFLSVPSFWAKASCLAMSVSDVAEAQGLEPLRPFFEALVPVYSIQDEALNFFLYEGFMESLVFKLRDARIPLEDVRARMAGEARTAWDAAVRYIQSNSNPRAGA